MVKSYDKRGKCIFFSTDGCAEGGGKTETGSEKRPDDSPAAVPVRRMPSAADGGGL